MKIFSVVYFLAKFLDHHRLISYPQHCNNIAFPELKSNVQKTVLNKALQNFRMDWKIILNVLGYYALMSS
jgi:hypothetical protein